MHPPKSVEGTASKMARWSIMCFGLFSRQAYSWFRRSMTSFSYASRIVLMIRLRFTTWSFNILINRLGGILSSMSWFGISTVSAWRFLLRLDCCSSSTISLSDFWGASSKSEERILSSFCSTFVDASSEVSLEASSSAPLSPPSDIFSNCIFTSSPAAKVTEYQSSPWIPFTVPLRPSGKVTSSSNAMGIVYTAKERYPG